MKLMIIQVHRYENAKRKLEIIQNILYIILERNECLNFILVLWANYSRIYAMLNVLQLVFVFEQFYTENKFQTPQFLPHFQCYRM